MGGPSVPTPSWTPQYSGQADTTYAQNLGFLSGGASQGYGLAGNVINNPYAAGVIPGAQAAGSYLSGTVGPQLERGAAATAGGANYGLPYAEAILNTGFDPQKALYARTLQQTQDQTLAGLSATGVASSPYGAGVLGQTLGNFNLGWQNAQLGRQAQALGSYGGYLDQFGRSQEQAGVLGQQGAGAITAGTSLPYSTYAGMQERGLGALGQATGIGQAATGAAGNYLSLADQNYQNQLQAYQAQLQQQQGMFGGIGSLLGLGADAFGSGGALSGLFGPSLTDLSFSALPGISASGGFASLANLGELAPLLAL